MNGREKRENKFISALFEEKFKAVAKALKLQAREYKRRLKDLNGEARRLREMQERYIPREVFDRTVDSINEKNSASIREIQNKINLLNDYKTKQEGRNSWLQYVPWIIAAISLVIAYFKK